MFDKSQRVLVAILCLLFFCRLSASYTVTITPSKADVTWYGSKPAFQCSADADLVQCQFSYWSHVISRKKVGVIDLSPGVENRTSDRIYSNPQLLAEEKGRECGVTLAVDKGRVWMVSCRVRRNGGGWNYATAYLDTFHHELLAVGSPPREVIVMPNEPARLPFMAEYPLGACIFYNVRHFLDYTEGMMSKKSGGVFHYLGEGPDMGQCGLQMVPSVTEKQAGPIRTYLVDTKWSKDVFIPLVLVAARRPAPPTLELDQANNLTTIICEVAYSRPLPEISIMVGDHEFTDVKVSVVPSKGGEEWWWPWMDAKLTGRVAMRFTGKHTETVAKCRVSHVALEQPLEASKAVWV